MFVRSDGIRAIRPKINAPRRITSTKFSRQVCKEKVDVEELDWLIVMGYFAFNSIVTSSVSRARPISLAAVCRMLSIVLEDQILLVISDTMRSRCAVS